MINVDWIVTQMLLVWAPNSVLQVAAANPVLDMPTISFIRHFAVGDPHPVVMLEFLNVDQICNNQFFLSIYQMKKL